MFYPSAYRVETIGRYAIVDDTINLYDLFDALIDRVPWRTEGEMKQYKELIAKLRDINLFGYMAYRIEVDKQWDSTNKRLGGSR